MLSVGRILEGAFGLLRERYVAVAVWTGIYLAGNIALMLSFGSMFGIATNTAVATDPSAVIGAMIPVYLISFVMGLVGIVLYAAAMRAVLRPEAGGLAYLRLGMDELRLLGLVILFGIVGFVLMVGFMILLGLLGVGAAMGSQSSGGTVIVMIVGMIALFAVMLYFIVRFSLAFPLTLHRGRITLGEAWRLSRGRFWTLFGAAFIISLLMFVLNMAVSLVTMGSYMFDMMAAAGNPEAAAQAMEAQSQSFGQLGPMMILSSLGGAVVAGLWVALSGGSIATAAKLLLDDEMDDAEDVFG
ncbi:hypothetical protein [Sphingomonas sp.]|jgi:hypothetical protein|uniref:hypothetical protein n=1 Tax=Sphingomonas sp. TaxID=28214 RepID=UPI002E1000B5|nr:hypothetical protein [Sphingomonas sp.]